VVGKESAPEILWSTHCLLSNAYWVLFHEGNRASALTCTLTPI
jgi:hypothetical protein